MNLAIASATAVEPSPQLLIDAWHNRFKEKAVQVRQVLLVAIEHDKDLLDGVQALVGEFPHHRLLSKWLLKNEDKPFFSSDKRAMRFVRTEYGWQLRYTMSLAPDAI